MFTGLIEDLGRVEAVERTDDGVRLTVATPLAAELRDGDSVAVNGVCLTAVGRRGRAASAPTSCTRRCGAPRWARSAPAAA